MSGTGVAILITGCDSGVGFSLAAHYAMLTVSSGDRASDERSHQNGEADSTAAEKLNAVGSDGPAEEQRLCMTTLVDAKGKGRYVDHVFAACHNISSDGATALAAYGEANDAGITVLELDVTMDSHPGDGKSADAADRPSIGRAVQTVSRRLHDLHLSLAAVVNNAAAPVILAPTLWQTADQIRSQVEVNVLGVVAVCRHFLPLLMSGTSEVTAPPRRRTACSKIFRSARRVDRSQRRPRIVNMVSFCTDMFFPATGPYASSKLMLSRLTDIMRIELASHGVHCILFNPGDYPYRTMLCRNQGRHYDAMAASNLPQCLAPPSKFEDYRQHFRMLFDDTDEAKIRAAGAETAGDCEPATSLTEHRHMLNEPKLFATFDRALRDVRPRRLYTNAGEWAKMRHWFVTRVLSRGQAERYASKRMNLPRDRNAC